MAGKIFPSVRLNILFIQQCGIKDMSSKVRFVEIWVCMYDFMIERVVDNYTTLYIFGPIIKRLITYKPGN